MCYPNNSPFELLLAYSLVFFAGVITVQIWRHETRRRCCPAGE